MSRLIGVVPRKRAPEKICHPPGTTAAASNRRRQHPTDGDRRQYFLPETGSIKMVPYNRLDTVQQQMSSWSSIRKRKEKSIDFNKYLYIFVFFTNQTREGVSRYQTDILGVVSCGSLFNSRCCCNNRRGSIFGNTYNFEFDCRWSWADRTRGLRYHRPGTTTVSSVTPNTKKEANRRTVSSKIMAIIDVDRWLKKLNLLVIVPGQIASDGCDVTNQE